MRVATPQDRTFLGACRALLLDRWFHDNSPGGTAFRIRSIYMIGLTPQATIDFGIGGSKTGDFYAMFNDMVDGKIVPLADEPEELPDEY